MGFVVEFFFFVFFSLWFWKIGNYLCKICKNKTQTDKNRQTNIKKRVFQYHYNLLSNSWLNILFQTDYLWFVILTALVEKKCFVLQFYFIYLVIFIYSKVFNWEDSPPPNLNAFAFSQNLHFSKKLCVCLQAIWDGNKMSFYHAFASKLKVSQENEKALKYIYSFVFSDISVFSFYFSTLTK